jgi:prepilin-type N-terminal cleavage/methylation domain-containing protein
MNMSRTMRCTHSVASKGSRKRAFTLVEIMIVVLILSLLLEMAIPQFLTARMRAQQRTCMTNLREIEYAKELLAGNNKLADGDAVVMGDIWPEYVRCPGEPKCPAGGVYTVAAIGEKPECTLSAGNYSHVAP